MTSSEFDSFRPPEPPRRRGRGLGRGGKRKQRRDFGQGDGNREMSMVPDAIDYAEDKTGVRADGTSYATISLSTKFGSAFGGAIGIALIGSFGYVANAEQTAEALNGINLVTNVGAGIMFLLGCIPFFFYDLTEEKYSAIRARLDEQVTADEA